MTTTAVAARVPLVNYLVLEPEPRLVAEQCTACDAPYFEPRVACANCFGSEFRTVDVPTEGEVISFTIVAFAAPGVEVPFTAALVDCGGIRVVGNIVDTPTDPEHVTLGMKVRLTIHSLGLDEQGTEAVGFGFAPLDDGSN